MSWQRWEMNSGQQVVKRERYLCAMPAVSAETKPRLQQDLRVAGTSWTLTWWPSTELLPPRIPDESFSSPPKIEKIYFFKLNREETREKLQIMIKHHLKRELIIERCHHWLKNVIMRSGRCCIHWPSGLFSHGSGQNTFCSATTNTSCKFYS